jgi:hypothetical protein
MEAVKILEVQPRKLSGVGAWNVQIVLEPILVSGVPAARQAPGRATRSA